MAASSACPFPGLGGEASSEICRGLRRKRERMAALTRGPTFDGRGLNLQQTADRRTKMTTSGRNGSCSSYRVVF
jgi:hypothetical protein